MVRAEKSGEERRKAGGVKHFLAKRFPNLYRYYLAIRTPYRKGIYIDRFIKYLNREHAEICVSLLDVGARGGLNEIPIFKPLKHLNNRLIHGIEPEREEAERLRKSGEYDHVFTDGVAWYDGEAVLHVYDSNYSASIREIDSSIKSFRNRSSQSCRDIPIRVKKLSNILPKGMTYDFIKTDVEGCDYDVLASADPSLLENALCITCEAQNAPYFKGQHTTDELCSFLFKRQFLLCSAFIHGDFISQEIFYLKNPDSLSNLVALYKYILLCLLLDDMSGDPLYSCALYKYEHNYGKQKELDDVYRILNTVRI